MDKEKYNEEYKKYLIDAYKSIAILDGLKEEAYELYEQYYLNEGFEEREAFDMVAFLKKFLEWYTFNSKISERISKEVTNE